MALWVFMSVIVATVIWLMSRYNALVSCKGRLKGAFAQVDALLKHRYEVIDTLVESVRGCLPGEREGLDDVVRARDAAVSTRGQAALNPADQAALQQLSSAEAALARALRSLLGRVEACARSKSSQTILQLIDELASADKKLAAARGLYNDAVTEYNTTMKRFPANVVASTFAFSSARLL